MTITVMVIVATVIALTALIGAAASVCLAAWWLRGDWQDLRDRERNITEWTAKLRERESRVRRKEMALRFEERQAS